MFLTALLLNKGFIQVSIVKKGRMPCDCPFHCNLSNMQIVLIRVCFNLECQFYYQLFFYQAGGYFGFIATMEPARSFAW